MRRSLSFLCDGDELFGTVDDASGRTGLLIVTGGRQTRVGPHRMMAQLACDAAAEGYPVFRFDRRGVGDSSGSDPGFENSQQDILAAITAFRQACPHLDEVWGLGLCDGASALALLHPASELSGLILLNPWVVEADAENPPPAAIRAHYRDRLLTLAGWRKLVTQGFDPVALLRGLRNAVRKSDQQLATGVMTSLAAFEGPVAILLATRDATARAFLHDFGGVAGSGLRSKPHATLYTIDSASHSFAGAREQAWLTAKVLEILRGDA